MHTLLHPKLKDCRRLFLHNYEVPVKIGVYDFEKKGAQRLLINVDLYSRWRHRPQSTTSSAKWSIIRSFVTRCMNARRKAPQFSGNPV